MASKQSVTLTFQDPSGTPLANGSVTIQLQQDISSASLGGPQVCAGRAVVAALNASGVVTVELWPTDNTVPASVYFVRAYTQYGQLAWSGVITVSTAVGAYLLNDSGGLFVLDGGGFITLD